MSTPVTDNYVPYVFLTDEARDLNDSFYLILNKLVDTYTPAKQHPSTITNYDPTITNLQDYDNNMAAMMDLQSDYFLYKNSIVRASEALLLQVNTVDDQINVLDSTNQTLQSKLSDLASSGLSAEGMLDDSQLTRNQLFYGNVILFLFMVTSGYIYYKKVHKSI